MRLATIALLSALAACAQRDDAAANGDERVEEGASDAAPSEEAAATPPALPASFPEPAVAGRRFAITGRPTIDAAVFGKVRAYQNEKDGQVIQRGTYATTPDNQLCFHFEETAGNPCFTLEPVEGKNGTFLLKSINGQTVGELVDAGPSDLDG